ncbi:Alpha-tocopherol transfer protein-like [Pseudolycoriella hygida]|uniref:Alpha-tocopherol transfer protein-like n=1 Tax=Pseudolycoriella hygida TaxID=35572 RepID=A0A9Q0N5N5_9DIPT|nr:Alpha-tocopherol transfer protein-like [Pseudolycoriella hygida]
MVNIRPLDPSLQKKAIEELGEDPDRIQKDLDAFREWIKKSPHIKARNDDQFLVNFLRGCKYSLERAKQKFDLYHTLKTHIPELTRNRDPLNEKVLGAIKKGVGIPLPNLETPDGPRYFLIRPGAYDPDEHTIEDIIKVSTMIADLMLSTDDNYIVAGQIGILDFSGVNISHFLQFNPTFIKKMTMLQQDAAPIRQKASHFVNMPAIALTVFNIFQSFANEKNKQRIYVHGTDMDALYKVVPRKLLPKEYGGEAGPIQDIIDNLEKTLVENRNFFIEDEDYGVDEKKRVGKPKNSESLFGVDGSFRQLSID